MENLSNYASTCNLTKNDQVCRGNTCVHVCFSRLLPLTQKRYILRSLIEEVVVEEQQEEEFIYHKYTYTSNFRLIHVSDGLPEKQYHLCRPPMLEL